MRVTFLRVAAVLFVVLAGGCNGSGTPSGSVLPQTLKTASFSSTAASPIRIWFSSCSSCPFPMIPNKEVDLDVFSASGTELHSFAFSGGRGISWINAVSPDQRHVYETMFIGYNNTVADVDTQTYGVRYYSIPITSAQGYMNGLLPSPDGRLLYVPTTVRIYVIDTVTRTIARTIPAIVYSPVLSQDGKTLYGLTSSALVAIDTATSAVRTLASANPLDLFAVTSNYFYLSTGIGVRVYDSATDRYLKTLFPSDSVSSLTADPQINRLYALTQGPTGFNESIEVVDTTTQATVKTLPNQAEGPFVDPTTHVIYTIDPSANFCSYTPPAYGKSCTFTYSINPTIQWGIVFTH